MKPTRIVQVMDSKFVFVSADEYLACNKTRGRAFTNPRFNLTFHMVRNCLLIGGRGQLLVPVDSNKEFRVILEESFVYDHDDGSRWAWLCKGFADSRDFIELDEAVPVAHIWSDNFYHWIMEGLSKILVLEDQGYTGKYIVHKTGFVLETLRLFNIGEDRICFNDKDYIVKNMIIPPVYKGYDLSDDKYDMVVEHLCKRILDAVGILPGSKRVYIQRVRGRKVVNEDAVLDILAKYDFDVIVPEDHSVKKQLQLMTNVDFSITPHGANSTLIIAQKNRSVFMELFSSAYIVYHTVAIIKALSLDYIPLSEGRDHPVVLEKKQAAQFCDITVSIPVFKTVVANVIKRIF